MIQNSLQPHELRKLLQPFLRLSDVTTTLAILSEVLGTHIERSEDAVCQSKVLLSYKDYKVVIKDLRLLNESGFAVVIQFKCKKKWTHGLFKDQNKEIVQDIKIICQNEIDGLFFTRRTISPPRDPFRREEPQDMVFIHDARAFNKNWSAGTDISPLILAPDAHHGNCFIEFHF